jgi:murein L,D-transpeptidase YafK
LLDEGPGTAHQSGSFALNRRPLVRSLLASAAIAAALALGGCDTDSNSPSLRSLQPLSAKMLTDIDQKNMAKDSPILVRIFKDEAELEVWKEDKSGRFALLKTYPICRWSGELGPKLREGDRQAPEGFYTITPSLLNPNSSYYLAINMGFPNAYDKANGRTGAFLMIHGDCSSRGCYAMTDEQVAEIYALARESFFGGQTAFQIQAFPFRMTALNMAKHRNSPHLAFWKMLKQGYDHFEVTRLEPKVDVCEKRYVFDAQAPGGASTPLRFNAAAQCPVYEVPADIAAAVSEKQQRDNVQTAEFIRRGTPASPIRTGLDGGMNPIFLAALKPRDQYDENGRIRSLQPVAPGTIPAHVVPPGERNNVEIATASVGDVPVPREAPRTHVASAQPAQGSGLFGNLFSSNGSSAKQTGQEASPGVVDRMSRFIGLRGSDTSPAAETSAAKAKGTTAKQQPAVAAVRPKQAVPQQAETKSNGAIRPQQPQPAQQASAAPQNDQAGSASLLKGAQPTVPTGSFDSRWGTFR